MEDLLALHAQHFPQLRQALATLDADYVRRKMSGEIERHLHQERRRVVETFLSGLAEDFGRLERLLRVVREMSPAEPWIHQFQRAGRRFRFRVHYRIASLQIQSARLQSTNRWARLTALVGNLSLQIEAAARRLRVRVTYEIRLFCNAARWYPIRQLGISGPWAGPITETLGGPHRGNGKDSRGG